MCVFLVNIVFFFVGKYKGGRFWQHMAQKQGHGSFAFEVCQLAFDTLYLRHKSLLFGAPVFGRQL